MADKRAFFKCALCGNIVELVDNGGGPLSCCGQAMAALTPNTVDASQEKHLPVATRADGVLVVEIGSAPHPMTAEHHIAWVVVAQGHTTCRKALDVDGQPRAEFCIGDGPATIYAYCNLHGLWATELP